jgi:hypothetical protein
MIAHLALGLVFVFDGRGGLNHSLITTVEPTDPALLIFSSRPMREAQEQTVDPVQLKDMLLGSLDFIDRMRPQMLTMPSLQIEAAELFLFPLVPASTARAEHKRAG